MCYHHLITDRGLVIAEDVIILFKKLISCNFVKQLVLIFTFFKRKKLSHGRVYTEASLFSEEICGSSRSWKPKLWVCHPLLCPLGHAPFGENEKWSKEKERKFKNSPLPKPHINRIDISLLIVPRSAPQSSRGTGLPRPQSWAWCSLSFTQGAKCCLATAILSALTTAAACRPDNRAEFESEILIFQLLHCGKGE